MRVRKAVFPAAGWGTRFLPATKAQPKEMLPLVDKPVIQYAVEEAVAAGIEQVIIVTSSQKRAIEDHFDTVLRARAPARGEGRHRDAPPDPPHLGPGPGRRTSARRSSSGSATRCSMAKELVGHEPFAVILSDDVVVGDRPCIGQLVHAYNQTHSLGRRGHGGPARGDEPLRRDRRRAGRGRPQPRPAAQGHRGSSRSRSPADAPSNLAIIGRYVLTPKIFDKLEQTQKGAGGEIQLTDAIEALMQEQAVYGYEFEGTRYDAGTTMGWLKASVELALQRPELAPEFRTYLQSLEL